MNPHESQNGAAYGSNKHHHLIWLLVIMIICAAAVSAAVYLYVIRQPVSDGDTVYVPEMKLPDTNEAASMDMIGLIVYQGRIYTQTGTSISPEYAGQLLGEKIGRTKGSINEWSKQDDYATELASSIGQIDIYTVKGYDPAFRIMSYEVVEDSIITEIYECLNGMSFSSGADIVNRLKLQGRIVSAVWEEFDSWNYNRNQYRQVHSLAVLDEFIQALSAAKAVSQDVIRDQGLHENGEGRRRFITVQLEDHTEVRLQLFKEGYVTYDRSPAFAVESASFAAFWDSLP